MRERVREILREKVRERFEPLKDLLMQLFTQLLTHFVLLAAGRLGSPPRVLPGSASRRSNPFAVFPWGTAIRAAI